MSLLSRHVAELKSEEFVLGVSAGWRSDGKDEKFKDLESTKIMIVSAPQSKTWNGFTAIEQSVGDASVGEAMKGKLFPARCFITYRRVTQTEKKVVGTNAVVKDIEKLVVVAIEYIAQVDLVDVKIPKAA